MGVRIQQSPGRYNIPVSDRDKRSIITNYLIGIKSPREIAKLYSIHDCTLYKILRQFNIPTLRKLKKKREHNTNTKRCVECKQWLSIESFYKRQFRGPCIICYKKRNNLKRKKAILYLSNKCKECDKENLPMCCYHFHHRNPEEKEYEPAHYARLNDWDKVKKELDKCDLVCNNCHTVIHHGTLKATEVA